MTTKAEQETIIRWDQEEHVAWLYTAHPAQARRWERLGYPMEVSDRDQRGSPTGWGAKVPVEAIRFRKVRDGAVVKRRTGGGRQFRAINCVSGRRGWYRISPPRPAMLAREGG